MEDNEILFNELQDELQDEQGVESTNETKHVEKEKNTISADLIRGHINTIILRTLYERDKYGYEIMDEIEEKSHGQYSLKQPTLYSALKRLETQGYIQAYWKSDEVSSGGRRKYFKLTQSGKEITEKNLAEWEYSRTVIDSLISDKNFDFSRPAPTYVDFNILKKSTSRVPKVKLEEVDGDEKEDDEIQDQINDENLLEQRQLLEKNESAIKELEEKQRSYEEQNQLALKLIEEKRLQLEQEQALSEEKLASIQEMEERLNAEKLALEEKQKEYEDKLQQELDYKLNEQQHEFEEERQEYEAQILKTQQELEEQRKQLENQQNLNDDKLYSLNEYEAQLNAQKLEFEAQQQSYETVLATQRQAIAEQQQALENQRQALAKQQYETEQKAIENEKLLQRRIEEEQRNIAHSNYIRLVNGEQLPQQQSEPNINYAPPRNTSETNENAVYNMKPETERDYKNLVDKLFANTVKTVVEPPVNTQKQSYSQTDSVSYNNPYAKSRDEVSAKAFNDGLKINASTSVKKANDRPPYDMGFAILKSSLIVAVILMVEFILTLLFKDVITVGIAYPLVILAINVVQLLMSAAICFSGTLKTYKKPTNTNYVSTSIIITIVLILIICLIALLLNVDFSSIGDICAKMLIPCVIALNVPIYSVCFYTFSK